MDSSYPVIPTGAGSPQVRRSDLAPHSPPKGPPLHQAKELGFGGKLREDCWESIGARSRERLHELTGDTIEWYAAADPSSPDGRPYGVVIGDLGLAVAEPRINTEHRPVYAISAFLFTPGSLRHVKVDHRPPPHPPAASGGPTPPGPPSTGPDLGLTAGARGVIGNLPPRGQELLQAPFTTDRRPLRCDWWYQGFEHRLDVFLVYLAGARDVTLAVGTKDIPAGHSDATAHWALTCYRASVERRIGK